jgi:eukaryotic translation initiation factor 2C
MGYHQSVRPAHGRVLINLDTAATVFHKAQPLQNLVQDTLGVRDMRQVSARDRNTLRGALSGLKVEVTHRGTQRRKYRIRDIAREDATQHEFDVEEEDGTSRKTNVLEYFNTRYNVQLRFPNAPLVTVGSKKRPIYLRMLFP